MDLLIGLFDLYSDRVEIGVLGSSAFPLPFLGALTDKMKKIIENEYHYRVIMITTVSPREQK
jgi:cell shape-determining protein MreD